MPDDYTLTVQLLERYICAVHISVIFECSSVSDANKAILECLTEKITCKKHVLYFCEKLLLIKGAPELNSVVEDLRQCKYVLFLYTVKFLYMCYMSVKFI